MSKVIPVMHSYVGNFVDGNTLYQLMKMISNWIDFKT